MTVTWFTQDGPQQDFEGFDEALGPAVTSLRQRKAIPPAESAYLEEIPLDRIPGSPPGYRAAFMVKYGDAETGDVLAERL